jgi:uncharacterized protein (TIGR02246 family)
MQANTIKGASHIPAAAGDGDQALIAAVQSTYNDALNASSADRSLALYADDGVFMPPCSQSAVGKAPVHKAYRKVFDTTRLNVKFTIEEIVQMLPTGAFVRTNSVGTNKVNAPRR